MGKKRKKAQKKVQKETVKRRGIDRIYHDYYKALLLIPFILLLLAFLVIGVNYSQTGQIVATGVSLSGGLTMTIPTEDDPVNVDNLETELRGAFENDLLIRELEELGQQQAVSIQMAPLTPDQDLEVLEESLLDVLREDFPDIEETYTVEIVGPSLGASFLIQTIWALLAAFLFMAIVVFYIFRSFIPSIAVVLAAFSDIVITLAVIILLDVKLSTAGIAGFLMLIGYSVDTDILLNTRVLKRVGGTVYDRIKNAVNTGLVMNVTTLVAVSLAFIVTQSEVIQQIMLILLIGLVIDVINTWIQNAGILRWYLEAKE